MGASILYEEQTRKANCSHYAFLVDKDWFERSSSAEAVKSRSHVPVVLEWNIINSTSSFALFGSYVTENFDLYYNNTNYIIIIIRLHPSALWIPTIAQRFLVTAQKALKEIPIFFKLVKKLLSL
ncbi:unnamed protein product [Prunus armeniaca]|uniref:Uncharacterized protein n=1 Tax=Prunus armeniaca TaxID=36596 RepID=A0A6J5UDL7_PRUAR|nr:unnamed protein product [Prunus armeniaca]